MVSVCTSTVCLHMTYFGNEIAIFLPLKSRRTVAPKGRMGFGKPTLVATGELSDRADGEKIKIIHDSLITTMSKVESNHRGDRADRHTLSNRAR